MPNMEPFDFEQSDQPSQQQSLSWSSQMSPSLEPQLPVSPPPRQPASPPPSQSQLPPSTSPLPTNPQHPATALIPDSLPTTAAPEPPPAPRRDRGLYFSGRMTALLSIFIILALVAGGTALGVVLTTDNPTVVEVAREIVRESQSNSSQQDQSAAASSGDPAGDPAADAAATATAQPDPTDSTVAAAESIIPTEAEIEAAIAAIDSEAAAEAVIVDTVLQSGQATGVAVNADQDITELEALPRSMSAIVEDLLPSAVTIYYSIEAADYSSTGSGVIYDGSGLIITAAHVLSAYQSSTGRFINPSEGEVLVEFNNGDVVRAEVVGLDRAIDVALLRFDPDGLDFEVAEIADLEQARVGDWAIAVGSPFSYRNSVNVGIISSLNRVGQSNFETDPDILVPAIQTDAPINSGNSGGMLANIDGEVMGINVYIQTTRTIAGEATGNLGIGFAVPIDLAIRVVDKILEGENFTFGALGIVGQTNRLEGTGAFVTELVEDGPAARGGLQVDDRIVAYDSVSLVDMSDLISRVQFTEPGTQVIVTVKRGGSDADVNLPIVIRESDIATGTLIFS